ncbi:hypothetical protein GH714_019809 [Hevea brasiliensis]|uniref:Uncharacterized protein n=1 Tax=Hevea brasiliensis TaxID=3981 RepID=A0A6A6M580_HEVBR|nr:hypothetical protein GH714_019809 [Hevea brasiliensis]
MKGSTAIAEGAAFITKNSSRDAGPRNQNMTKDTSKLFCEHCKHSKHTKETCFELHGYLEWWGDRNKKSQGKMANNTCITESTDVSPIAGLSKDQYAQLMSLLNLESNQGSQPIANFAGKVRSLFKNNYDWILDLGPSHEDVDWHG